MKTSFGYSDAMSKAKVWEAYAKHYGGEEIMEEGFNINTGYVYLALDNGITIASNFGQEVIYFVNDFETEEELEFDSYEELEIYLINKAL
jgi:hypothetical protein